MTTTNSPGAGKKVNVHISKETGGAYADVLEVVEDELERIKSERSSEAQPQGEGLLPCPFCGKLPETGITGAPECDNWQYVKCSNNYCAIRYSLFTVTGWNTRADLPHATAGSAEERAQRFVEAWHQVFHTSKQFPKIAPATSFRDLRELINGIAK